MPEILDRCVQHVMGKGHSESSAYAICRTSIGLLSDGSQDDTEPEISEDEIQRRVEMALTFKTGPVLIKRMWIASPIGKFQNGPNQKGTITRARLEALVKAQQERPRQIPIYLLGDHPDTNDQRPADGYVEGLSLDENGDLYATPAKLVGRAAEWVAQDRIRGASIYTRQGTDYEGHPVGEYLKHVLLTDEAFMREGNVAASSLGGAEAPGVGFTAFDKEGISMPDPKKQDDGAMPTKAEIDDAKALRLITHQESEIVRLKAENIGLSETNETLKKQLESTPPDEEKDELKVRVARLEMTTKAQEIRELVMSGLKRGTLKAAWCKGYNEGGDKGTLDWFAASTNRFGGDLKLLKYQVEQTEPIVKIGERFATGAPPEGEQAVAMSAEDKAALKKKGVNVDSTAFMRGVRNMSDYRAAKAQDGGK